MAQPKIEKLTFTVQGLDCPDCASSLEKAVQGLPGVASAALVFAASKLYVTPADGRDVTADVVQVATSLGYEMTVDGRSSPAQAPGKISWLRQHRRDLATGVAGLLILAGLLGRWFGGAEWLWRGLFGAAIVVGGFYVARAGWMALRTSRSVDMNLLMTIAAVGAMVIGEFEEGALTVFLFSIGELLEAYSMDRARNAVRTLMDLTPAMATVMRAAGQVTAPVADLQVGERILVRPGERLPMDGKILEGRSALNQAPITGESIPVEKAVGDEVYAGTINGNGALVVEVTRLAEDNTLSRIARMVEEAQAQRASSQRFVDRFARVYTPIVVVLAGLVAVAPPLLALGTWGDWFYRALVLLVIACPCALVISTPVTIVSALARAARAGVLIKGGRYLEELASLRVIAFDKTGTLTQGTPFVVRAACALHPEDATACANCEDLIAKAAAVEGRSEHALGRAVLQHAQALGLDARYAASDEVNAITGMGIEGRVAGHTVSVGSHAFSHRNGDGEDSLCAAIVEAEGQGHTVLVVEDNCCKNSSYLVVSDRLRPGVPQMIREIKDLGIARTVMLTGDNPFIGRLIAEKAGIDEFHAGLLPQDKVQTVENLEQRYGRVAMVGDGVNDAPALARASVGIAMGAAGTDTALETADVALMGDDLAKLPFAMRLSQRALGVVRANVALALLIKASFMALALAGLATLWMAVIADVGASLLVTLNGLRMLRFRERNAR